MNCHKISYCNSNGFLIKNDRSKFDIINNIKYRLGYDILNPLVKSYSDRLLPIIKKNNLITTYITSGKNVYMYLTKIYNENICLIIELDINKNNKYPKIISIPCNFSDELFNDTIFYGEIYRDHKNKWFFLIEDIKMYLGKKCNKNIFEKIKLINDILGNNYKFLAISPLIVKVKKYFPNNKISENIDKLDIRLKGVKFMGLKIPICFYFMTNMYNRNKNLIYELPYKLEDLKKNKKEIKEEYLNEQQLDLEIIDTFLEYEEKEYYLELRKSKTYGIYDLFAQKNKYIEKVGIARIDTIEMSVSLLEKLNTNNALIVKTKLDKSFKKFIVLEIINKRKLSSYNSIIQELDIISKFPKPNYIKN